MNTKEEIKKKILKMYKEDQDMCTRFLKIGHLKKLYDKDLLSRNTKEIKKIVDKIGWPKISEYGEEVSNATFILVQHAFEDVLFQEKALSMMKKLPEGEVWKRSIAMLEDRILIFKGKSQLYGTQFDIDKKAGTVKVKPIEDIGSLEKRRVEMGMDSFEKEKERLYKLYIKGETGPEERY